VFQRGVALQILIGHERRGLGGCRTRPEPQRDGGGRCQPAYRSRPGCLLHGFTVSSDFFFTCASIRARRFFSVSVLVCSSLASRSVTWAFSCAVLMTWRTSSACAMQRSSTSRASSGSCLLRRSHAVPS